MLYILFWLIATLFSLLFIIFIMKHLLKYQRIVNIIFIVLIFSLYLIALVRTYLDMGPLDWNFTNSLPIANVSPFLFASIILALFLPKRINQYFLLLISLLIVGMFLSPTFGCIFNALRAYQFHWYISLDYVTHFLVVLFGIYIIKSKQVNLNKKNALISSSIIIVVAMIMLILNLVFKTSFFGLGFNGNFNIYNMKIAPNGFLNALLYFVGLIIVLIMGYFIEKLINKKEKN